MRSQMGETIDADLLNHGNEINITINSVPAITATNVT